MSIPDFSMTLVGFYLIRGDAKMTGTGFRCIEVRKSFDIITLIRFGLDHQDSI
jgi:hypothetical protein